MDQSMSSQRRVHQDEVCFVFKYSLMTAVPLPGVTWPVRHEVSSPFVLHPLWEPQQDPYVIIGGLGAIGGTGLGQKKKRILSVSYK